MTEKERLLAVRDEEGVREGVLRGMKINCPQSS
jgi:hypothetical protein